MRRKIATTLLILTILASGGFVYYILDLWRRFAQSPPGEEALQVAVQLHGTIAGVLIGVGILGWLLTFDSRRARRPWYLFLPALFLSGFCGGLVGVEALSAFEVVLDETPAISMQNLGMAAGCGIALALIFALFELINRLSWPRLAGFFDKKELSGPALFCNRVALLFKPGQTGMLRSVALTRFRNGVRGEVVDTLRHLYDAGKQDPDILEALCKHASEERNMDEYLRYIRELYEALPEEEGIREAYLDALVEERRYKEALELIEEHGVPKDPESMERFAEILIHEGQIDRATEVARELGEKEGIPFRASQKLLREILARVSEYVPALNTLAAQAERMALREQRIRWLEKSYAADQRQPEVRQQLITIYRELRQIVRLEELIQEVVHENPNDRELVHEFATILYDNGKLDEARERLKGINARNKPLARALLLEARINFEDDDFEKARELAQRALEASPTADEEKDIEELLNRVDKAVLTSEVADVLTQARSNPDDVELQFDALEKLLKGGHVDKFVGQADRILEHHPEARDRLIERMTSISQQPEAPYAVLNLLSNLLVEQNRLDEALDIVKLMAERSTDRVVSMRDGTQKILRRSPHHLPTLHALGNVYLEHGKFTDMIHSYSLYLSNGGEENEEIDRALVKAYFSLDDYKSAKKFADRLLEKNAEDLELLKRIATLALQVDEPEDAANYLKRMEMIDARDRDVRKLKEKVSVGMGKRRFNFLKREYDSGKAGAEALEQLGDIARDMQDFNDAITYYQRASRDREDVNRARRCTAKLAWCYMKKHLEDLAAETMREITLSLDDDPDTLQAIMDLLYEIGDMYAEAKMYDRAGKVFKQLCKIDAGYRDVLARVENVNR